MSFFSLFKIARIHCATYAFIRFIFLPAHYIVTWIGFPKSWQKLFFGWLFWFTKSWLIPVMPFHCKFSDSSAIRIFGTQILSFFQIIKVISYISIKITFIFSTTEKTYWFSNCCIKKINCLGLKSVSLFG